MLCSLAINCMIMMLASTSSLSIDGTTATTKQQQQQALTLIGRSRAGEGTAFCIPELHWMLDCGALIQPWKPSTIFLSHTHPDHVYCLTNQLFHRHDTPRHTTTVYLPAAAEQLVQNYLKAFQEMTDCHTSVESTKVGYELRPMRPNESIAIRHKGREFLVKTIECDHRIDCIGYSIFQKKQTLKEEFKNLPGREIGMLRKQGVVDVMDSYHEPVICFLGDTTHAVFERHPEILRENKVIVVECSFFQKADLHRADRTKHMHWDRLKPIVEAHPEILFVLIHFSLKYKSIEIQSFFEEFRNVHPMLIEEEMLTQWDKQKVKGEQQLQHFPKCKCFRCCPEHTSV